MGKHDGCCTHDHGHNHSHDLTEFDGKKTVILIGFSTVLFFIGVIFNEALHNTPYSIGEYGVFLPAYLISGWSVITSAGRNILKGHIFDENFLMTLATISAIALHKLPEAVAVMLFFQVGELFQNYAVGKSRRSIKSLLEIRPDSANLKTDEGVKTVSPDTVKVGDLIIIKAGEKVPLDGEIVLGKSQIDTSALTGESIPQTVQEGDNILAGSINQSGVLTVKVTKLFAESSISKILDLVENANTKKAKTEKFITSFAGYYTPAVVFLSLAVAILPPLFLGLGSETLTQWAYRALILLVISCPCGLVISIPLGYFGGVGNAAKNGILVKGATFLDTLTEVKTVVFDKTGTLTKGNFRVTDIVTDNGLTQLELLALAATVESQSNHPVAKSILEEYGKTVDDSTLENYQEISGHGIVARVKNQRVLVGNDRLLHLENIPHDQEICNLNGTIVHIAVDGQYIGYLMVADELKEDAVVAIKQLKSKGIEVVMLTGDNISVAQSIAEKLAITRYQAELLPEDKVNAIEEILGQVSSEKTKVAFVGDGINDAPVIARADVGIAMGGLGSDAAIETADIVIMADMPSKISQAIAIAQKTRQIVWQNISFALGIKGLFILLGAIGLATLWEAIFADVGVALIAIVNAGRVLRFKS
ncbi:heavy metal translocating P-type ATPase [Geminocystis sp. NIES-3709]|uniref:heavy metal translocating P-type ATPase n=1 Tax=Geminocystis sp. NIES-3709 TaxID=1617448 RepID=UPI0005FCCF58|nr:heavy metal translocating P-type ATPase [Geminocystis sp. NIES-3709]BAQ66356.1 Lead, cadmium, zinc and mercury transporting ATPase [Geminocystis sp. NIES-3709]